jgi:hypothetical protein
MQDNDSKRYCIGREGLPSRDLGQRRRDEKCAIEGFQYQT